MAEVRNAVMLRDVEAEERGRNYLRVWVYKNKRIYRLVPSTMRYSSDRVDCEYWLRVGVRVHSNWSDDALARIMWVRRVPGRIRSFILRPYFYWQVQRGDYDEE